MAAALRMQPTPVLTQLKSAPVHATGSAAPEVGSGDSGDSAADGHRVAGYSNGSVQEYSDEEVMHGLGIPWATGVKIVTVADDQKSGGSSSSYVNNVTNDSDDNSDCSSDDESDSECSAAAPGLRRGGHFFQQLQLVVLCALAVLAVTTLEV
eukprot:171261-Pyramimonas_sp.AAC.2